MIGRRLTAAAAILLVPLAAAAAVGDFELQLEEVRRLIEEGSYFTALEDLKFMSQQIQELRMAETAPLFPSPPPGWTAEPPLRTSLEGDTWSRRLRVQRRYAPEKGPGRIDMVLDFYSPLIPEVVMGLNPVLVAGDPRASLVKVRGRQAKLWFNRDTGEGELLFVLGGRLLVSVVGRGVDSGNRLPEFAGRLDLDALESFSLR